jgi:hypothetical protein
MSRQGRASRWALGGLVALAGLAVASVAFAQTPAPRGRAVELGIGISWAGATSQGSSDINFQAPDGSSLTVGKTESRLSPGIGLEARLGFRLSSRVSADVTGRWTRAEFQQKVSGDIESADAATLTARMSRFSLGGTTLWQLSRHGKTEVFALAGLHWFREVAEGSLVEDGLGVDVGAGLKYLWRDQARGRLKRVGLRIEGRLDIRSAGISLGPPSRRVSPVFAGSLLVGF